MAFYSGLVGIVGHDECRVSYFDAIFALMGWSKTTMSGQIAAITIPSPSILIIISHI